MMGQSEKPDNDTELGGVADTPRGPCWFPKGPKQAGEMGWQEPRDHQQREVQTPLPGEEQPQVPGWAGHQPDGKTQS